MLSLYYRPTCTFCNRVLAAIKRMNIPVKLKDVSSDKRSLEELIERNGKRQVPFLVDTERGESMLESADIIEYLEKHYGSGDTPSSVTRLRIHDTGSTCGKSE